jgi:outer membrane protein assembly factor BamA
LALGAGYLFTADKNSDPSSVGVGGFGTENGSEGLAIGANLNFLENRWHLSLVAGKADLDYDVYLLDIAFPISQSAEFVAADLAYSITPNIALGGGLTFAGTTLGYGGGELPPELVPDDDINLGKISFGGEWDSRDDPFYPTQGALVTGKLGLAKVVERRGGFLGGLLGDEDRIYTKAVVSAAGYRPLFEDSVLAGRAVACAVSDKAPFFDACSLGGVDGFRGYSATRYIGDSLLSAQAEFRTRLTPRLGLVLFAGAGSVGSDLGDAIGGDYRFAGGGGLRLRLSKAFKLDYAVDASLNEDGEEILYISVGQRF